MIDKRSVESAFDDELPATGAFLAGESEPVRDYKEGVRAALAGFQERVAAGKVKPNREKPKKTGRADLNEPCRKHLAGLGLKFERVDYFDHLTKRSHDLLGMFDYLAFGDGQTIGVQLTSRNNVAARVTKLKADKRLAWVHKAGWTVWVLGFDKNSSGRWQAETRVVVPE